MSTQGNWLLLDPPSGCGYMRRGAFREKSDAPPAPFPNIDLILLSGYVRRAGYTPRYLDAQLRRWSWQQVATAAQSMQARGLIVALSAAQIEAELGGLREMQRTTGPLPIYAVAPVHLVVNPARCRQVLEEHPWLSGIMLNTAEHNLDQVLCDPDALPVNVAVQRAGQVVVPKLTVEYGTGLRIPQPVHALFRDRRYFMPQTRRRPVSCVQLSFGCPFRCEFCLDNAIYRQMRYRAVDDVVAELVELERLGFREVYFKDLTFGSHKAVTTGFLEKLTAARLRLRWLCTTRVDVATPRLLDLMRRAGCFGIEFGVESGVRHRRAAVGKSISDERIREVFERCRRLGLETTAFVMMGFEDETEEEIHTTMRFVEALRPTFASYNVVTALAGTPLEARARTEGFLRPESADITFAGSNLRHRYLTPARLARLHAEAIRSFYLKPGALLRRLARLRSVSEFQKLLAMGRYTWRRAGRRKRSERMVEPEPRGLTRTSGDLSLPVIQLPLADGCGRGNLPAVGNQGVLT